MAWFHWLSAAMVAAVIGAMAGWSIFAPAAAVAAIPLLLIAAPRALIACSFLVLGLAPLFTGTVAIGVVSALILAVGIVGGPIPKALRRNWIMLLFPVYIVLTGLWSSSSGATTALTVSPLVIIALGFLRWPISSRGAVFALLAGGSLQAAGAIAAWLSAGGIRVTTLGLYSLPLVLAGATSSIVMVVEAQRPRSRLAYVCCATLCISGILVTETRGMALGVLFAVAVYGIWLVRRKERDSRLTRSRLGSALSLACLSALVLAAGAQLLSERVRGDALAEGIGGRITEFAFARDVYLEAPLFGHGVGHLFDNPIASGSVEVSYVHNSFAFYAISGGIVGALLFLVVCWRTVRGRPWSSVGVEERALMVQAVAVIAYSATSAVHRTAQFNVLIAMTASVVAASAHRRRRHGASAVATS